MNSTPASERDKNTSEQTIRTYKHDNFAPTALLDIPQTLHVVELVVPILKGAHHFLTQFVVFPLG